jgi:hypothetical protein
MALTKGAGPLGEKRSDTFKLRHLGAKGPWVEFRAMGGARGG